MNKLKTMFTTVLATLAGWLGILAIPVMILILCNIIDYVTGLVASPYRGQCIDSYKGFRGIAKKICMWLLVVVGAMIDQLILYAGGTIGIMLPFTYLVACVVAVWLICNEVISILENITDIGVNIPPFLMPIAKNIKKQVEDKTEVLDINSGSVDSDKGGKTND